MPVLPQPTIPFDPTDPISVVVWSNFWLSLTDVGGNVAPSNAQYLVATPDSSLLNERNLGALATGFLFLTVAAGIAVPSSVGTVPLARGGTHADLSATGGAGQLLRQSGVGADVTVSALAVADLDPFSGVYTPTLTNVTNLSASTAYQCQFCRVGSVVTVSGRVDVDPTLAVDTELGISLPIASNFAATEDCGGVAFAAGVAGLGAAILADTASDRATMRWVAVNLTNQGLWFTFSYRVL